MTLAPLMTSGPSPRMQQSNEQSALAMAHSLGRDEPGCLLIRHAARHPIPAGEAGADIQLTEAGAASARLAGERLHDGRITRIVTSPLQRCVDTGRFLIEGSGCGVAQEIDDRLGDGGMFVEDRALSQASLAEHGGPSTIWQLLVSSSPPEGFGPLRDGLEAYVAWIRECLESGSGLTIMVTHDSNIAAVTGGLLGLTPLIDAWPGFLDGLLFRLDGERMTAQYRRSQTTRISMKETQG
jgi:broad specificity phosphatase PhoE